MTAREREALRDAIAADMEADWPDFLKEAPPEHVAQAKTGLMRTATRLADRLIARGYSAAIVDPEEPPSSDECDATAAAPVNHYRDWETFGHVCGRPKGHTANHGCVCSFWWGTATEDAAKRHRRSV